MNTSHAPMLSRSRALVLPLVLLMSLGVSLVSPVSAAVPIAPPAGGIVGGLFSQYFTNMRAPCATGEVIQGFTPVLFPICLDLPIAISNYLGTNIGGIIRDYLATNVATSTGNVLTGFNLTGDAVYASGISSQWKSGFLPGSIYYSSGNVGIGAIPGAMVTERLQVVGNIAVSGNITAAMPTATGHLATKAYVDAAVVSGAVGGGTSICTLRPSCSASEINKHDFIIDETTFLESSIVRVIGPTIAPDYPVTRSCELEIYSPGSAVWTAVGAGGTRTPWYSGGLYFTCTPWKLCCQ